ncbi:MAG: thiamine pyrophosphate-dependent dehydrogenase E1 component subunit alpha [Alphaproteobacteria bacterium]|nr:thiamine pyrophosphate-dependent dehydrogenase E1 component subunit alpha [Alphaproteobacteria bacterium]
MTSLFEHFKAMARLRAFDEACLDGFHKGEIHGELHTGIGQEAIAAGMIPSLEAGDALVSTHRNHMHGLAKGVDAHALMAEIFHRETGLCRGRGGHMHPFDLGQNFSATGIVGASLPVALGYAYAFWMEGRANVGIGITGDGGANAGAFHECLNIAGAWKLPFVVVVENNAYAISVPIRHVLATPTIAERAAAYGAPGWRVDGTDPEAVAEAFARAMEHARAGRGPAIVEATCQRFQGHYEGDHDSYRSRDEKRRMKAEHDPLAITRRKLVAAGDATDLDAILAAAKAEMAGILERVRGEPRPDAADALRYRFAS